MGMSTYQLATVQDAANLGGVTPTGTTTKIINKSWLDSYGSTYKVKLKSAKESAYTSAKCIVYDDLEKATPYGYYQVNLDSGNLGNLTTRTVTFCGVLYRHNNLNNIYYSTQYTTTSNPTISIKAENIAQRHVIGEFFRDEYPNACSIKVEDSVIIGNPELTTANAPVSFVNVYNTTLSTIVNAYLTNNLTINGSGTSVDPYIVNLEIVTEDWK